MKDKSDNLTSSCDTRMHEMLDEASRLGVIPPDKPLSQLIAAPRKAHKIRARASNFVMLPMIFVYTATIGGIRCPLLQNFFHFSFYQPKFSSFIVLSPNFLLKLIESGL